MSKIAGISTGRLMDVGNVTRVYYGSGVCILSVIGEVSCRRRTETSIKGKSSRKHTYIILNPLNPTFI